MSATFRLSMTSEGLMRLVALAVPSAALLHSDGNFARVTKSSVRKRMPTIMMAVSWAKASALVVAML